MTNKNIEYYMDLPYHYLITPMNDENGKYFYARVLELDGCQSDGDTREGALQNLKEAMEGWIEICLENGSNIPEPVGDDHFSGKFNIRIPKSLHRSLTLQAELEGVSLNQFVLYKLSR